MEEKECHVMIEANSPLLWDVFIINSDEQLQTLPKIQSEIDISPFLNTKTLKIAD
jgi:hypothetical protein